MIRRILATKRMEGEELDLFVWRVNDRVSHVIEKYRTRTLSAGSPIFASQQRNGNSFGVVT